jgi:hypothetical protein
LIERDPAINCRAGGVKEAVAEDYAEAIRNGAILPPVVVFRDSEGKHLLADGFHRVRAHEIAEKTEIAVDVREGDRRAALLFAAGANASHGARRTNKDKRRSVAVLLTDPEWAAWSDAVIAEKCGVSQPFVSAIRRTTQKDSDRRERRGKDGRLTKGPARKTKGKRELTQSRAVRLAQKSLARVTKEWPAAFPRDLLLTAAQAWLRDLENPDRPVPTGPVPPVPPVVARDPESVFSDEVHS